MNLDNIYDNIQMSVSSRDETKNYNLSEQQSNIHDNLKMKYKRLFVDKFIYTWLAIILGAICVL